MDSAKLLLEKQRLCQQEIRPGAGILQGELCGSPHGRILLHLPSEMLSN